MTISTLQKLITLSEMQGMKWCEMLEFLIEEKMKDYHDTVDEAMENTFETESEKVEAVKQ